jgi:hypothetical protein
MGTHTDVYKKLAEKYGVPDSELFTRVLNAMITPEEGEILLELQSPITVTELARKTNIDENQLPKRAG